MDLWAIVACSRVNVTFTFTQISNFMSSCTRTGGRTDMTKLTVAFRNFAKAPKNQGVKEAVEKSVDMSLLRQMTGL